MTKIEESHLWPEHETHLFPCDCSDTHFFFFEWDPDPAFRYMTISREWRPERLRDKLKACFKILRNKEYVQDSVILNDSAIEALKRVLSDK